MSIALRKTARALLLNEHKELLLMRIEVLDAAQADRVKYGSIWCTVGGAIEQGESLQEAIIREIYEETGIADIDVNVGPVVWYSKVELLFRGIRTLFDESYFVAKTTKLIVTTHAATEYEKENIKEYKWWSYDELQKTNEPVFPVNLRNYIADIMAGKYPEQPIDIS